MNIHERILHNNACSKAYQRYIADVKARHVPLSLIRLMELSEKFNSDQHIATSIAVDDFVMLNKELNKPIN